MTTDPYVNGPDLGAETEALHKLRRHLAEQGITTGPARRDYLLRHAVHLARLQAGTDWSSGEDEVLSAAWELIQYDRRYGTWSPTAPGPDSATWSDEDGALEYIRTQWLAARQANG